SQRPLRAARIAPFTGPHGERSIFRSSLFRFAAAASLALGAFLIGHQTARHPQVAAYSPNQTARDSAVPIAAEPAAGVEKTGQLALDESRTVAGNASPATTEGPTEPEVIPMPEPIIPAIVATANSGRADREPVAPLKDSTPARPSLNSFVIAAAHPETTVTLSPKLARRAKTQTMEFAGVILAAPMIGSLKADATRPASPRKLLPQPALVIHSWKAEIASCPWDSTRRLLRFVAQIPADQGAIESNDKEYRLAVKFDPALVRGYRLITEKHMPPGGNSNFATRFAWYEIIPANEINPTRDKPALLGVMEIVQPQGVAKDGQALQLLDRGLMWDEAREDFEFETAMIGFNLLLHGTDNIGSLNYQLVLDLAEQARGDDWRGERAKFIKTIQQAQKAAGL
ncbi:MAG: YfbK domain-containing protein, partial [Verrucomicrobiaceae bacterium]